MLQGETIDWPSPGLLCRNTVDKSVFFYDFYAIARVWLSQTTALFERRFVHSAFCLCGLEVNRNMNGYAGSWRPIVALLFCVCAMGSLAIGTPARVSAVGCSGASCNNSDPSQTGCSAGAYDLGTSVSSGYNDNVYVRGRFSPTCATRWSRAIYQGNPPSGGRPAFGAQLSGANFGYQTLGTAWSPGQVIWSPQRYATAAMACYVLGAWSPPPGYAGGHTNCGSLY
jgi:hypothetical protein